MIAKLLLIIWSFYSAIIFAGIPSISNEMQSFSLIKYRTSFGNCPTHLVGKLTLNLVDLYSKDRSLYKIKQWMLEQEIKKKYFLSHYGVRVHPLKNEMDLNFECSPPVFRVNFFENNFRTPQQSLVLNEDGEFVDPTYLYFLAEENKVPSFIPEVSLQKNESSDEILKKLLQFLVKRKLLMKEISEIIVQNDNKIFMTISINAQPIWVVIGEKGLEKKFKQLEKIVEYIKVQKKVPSTMNLSNSQKITIKF